VREREREVKAIPLEIKKKELMNLFRENR